VEFIAPLMLLGLAAAAVPIAIHLIGRRRAPVKRFGAIDFLFGSNKRVARRLRLRELLLLAVRVAACLAIPLALAKPFVSCSSAGMTVARGPQAVVLVLDNSFAMAARDGGVPLLDRARERARQLVEEMGPEADVAVLFTAEGADAPGELSRDHLRILDVLEDARVTMRPADTSGTLRRAAALLATSSHGARRVYLLSALAATGFRPGEDVSGVEIIPVPIPDQPLGNIAIVNVTAEKDPEMGPRGVAVTAEVANFGPTKRERTVTLRLGGRAIARGLVQLLPGERASKRFSAQLPAEERGAEIVVEVEGDELGVDDQRYLRVELRRDVRVLIVDGDPSTVRHDDEAFYLETALRPGDRGDSSVVVSVATADELARRKLSDVDVVFLLNVKPLDPPRVTELEGWVKKGGGLFISVGDNVDPDAYNGAMAPLLPQELRSLRRLADGPRDPEIGRAERLGRLDATHPIFQVFSSEAASLREARFWNIMLVDPTVTAEGRAILASFASGAPALIQAELGSGRVLLFTSTIDRDWNDLPIHPGFLPLVQQIARHLARAPLSDDDAQLLVGHTHEVPVAAGDQRIEITSPSGTKTVFDGARLANRTSVPFTSTNEVGFYSVAVTDSEGSARPRVSSNFVANLDPVGSDTRRVDLAALAASGSADPAAPKLARRRVELWHALAAALLLVLFGEALLTRRG
jgi:hypothetical protein